MRFEHIGRVVRYHLAGKTLVLECLKAQVYIAAMQNGTIRVDCLQTSQTLPHSYALKLPWSDYELQVPDLTNFGHYLHLQFTDFAVKIDLQPYALSVYGAQGQLLVEDDKTLSIGWLGNRIGHYKKLQSFERFIGLGEKTGNLDRWGKAYTNWNTDAFGYGPESDPIYASIPFYMGMHGGNMYGVFYDSTWKSEFNFGASNHRFTSFLAEGGPLTYYIFTAQTVAGLVKQYTELTGNMALPPMWALGLQQCRYSYYPDATVLQLADTYRRKGIPLDVIYLDIHYMEKFRVFTWNDEDFPNPEALIGKLAEWGIQVIVILDPGIAIAEDYQPYQRLIASGAYLQYPDGEPYTASVWPGKCIFPDFTSPKGRQFWSSHFDQLVKVGLAGFWNDMNEVATWGQASPVLVEMAMEQVDTKASHLEGRNVYGMQMARATFEGAVQHNPEKRPFVLTRAAYAGAQRYCAIWTGDNTASDEHLLLGVRLQNSLGLSGMPFAGMDIGGFIGEASPALFARWIQTGCFSPLMRIHSMIDSKPSEPWAYGERVEAIAINFIKLRYRLLPTLYQAMREASVSGLPVVRSLVFDYPYHDLTFDYRYQNQYYFGSALLICPTDSIQQFTAAWLPPHLGGYFQLYDDKHYGDGQEVALPSPLEQLPVLVKAGHLFWTYTEDRTELELHIYKGYGTTTAIYYEDENDGFGYLKGDCLIRKATIDHNKLVLNIDRQVGSYVSRYNALNLVFHGFEPIKQLLVNHTVTEVVSCEHQWVKALPSFDPLGYNPPSPKAKVQQVRVEFNQGIHLNWV